MKKCAILTMDQFSESIKDDKLLNKPMFDIGWQVDHVSWKNKKVNWNDYLAVIIRSTWDYQNDSDAFLNVLADIDDSDALLLNPLSVVKWNINKHYLKILEENGVEIVPTHWVEKFDYNLIPEYFSLFKTSQIVIKPTISANAENTFWLKKESFKQKQSLLEDSLKNKQLMVQPFIPAVVEEGEYSIFYFGGKYSHCILKTPKKGDFRVQEDYGSNLAKINPTDKLLSASKIAFNAIPENVLYARIDLVEFNNSYKVMEVELIEPSLYFSFDDQSPARFAMAFDDWMK